MKNKVGGLQLMAPLKLAQRKLIALIDYFRKKIEPVRIIVAKSRKTGISTLVAADMHDEVCRKGVDAILIANEKDLAEYLFDVIRRFHAYRGEVVAEKDWRGIPIFPIVTPGLYKGKTNKRELRFNSREGRIEVETAGNVYAGTGRTPQYVLASECSKWEKGADTAISLFQAMGLKPGTTFIMESTFNGYDGLFLPYWEGAYRNSRLTWTEEMDDGLMSMKPHFEVTNKEEWNGFVPLFIGVSEDEDARLPFEDDEERKRFQQTLTDYEKTALERWGASLECLKYVRKAQKLQCQGKEAVRRQEWPFTPEEAVISSGRNRFDLEKLAVMPVEEGERGSFGKTDTWDHQVRWARDPQQLCVRYRDRQAGHRYVVGVDVSEGLLDEFGKDPDASVITVLDLDAGLEQVCCFWGQVSEENLVTPLWMIATYYEAFVVIESNSTGKHVCIEMGKRYPRAMLYHRDDYDPEKSRMSREIGHRTHIGNKEGILISPLAESVHNMGVLLHCEKTVDELRKYVYKSGGGTGAEKGYHDDHPMSLALALLGARCYPQRRMVNSRQQQWNDRVRKANESRTYL